MRTLLVASTGGHLRELHRLRPRLASITSALWVSNDTLQSRTLLDGEETVYVPYQGSRNVGRTVANVPVALRLLRNGGFEQVVSTGSGIALSFLPPAAALGKRVHYIESATRVRGPSVTGRALHGVPGVRCYTQHEAWAGRRWRYGGSVLDGFSVATGRPRRVARVLVTLGTWRQPFDRLVRQLLKILPDDVEVVWQTGHTDVSDLSITPVPWLTPEELHRELATCDVVVTHAGMGAALDALEAGRLPVVVPRMKAAGEQIDDHQSELAEELELLGLAVSRHVDDLDMNALEITAATDVTSVDGGPFRLV